MLSHSKFRRLTNSIENNCSINKKRHDKQCIPLSVTYSRALPKLKDIITKHWHILQANQSCKETFSTLPIIAFRKGTSLKQIIGTNTIHNNEKLTKIKNNHHVGKCVPCNSTRCFYCQQLISTTFKRNQTNKTFKIYHRANCKSSFVYLLERYICNIQYIGKSETTFNIRKMSKIPMQCQLTNISAGTIMALTITEKATKKHSHDIN